MRNSEGGNILVLDSWLGNTPNAHSCEKCKCISFLVDVCLFRRAPIQIEICKHELIHWLLYMTEWFFFHFHCAPRTNVQINCARTRSCTNHDTANSSRGKGLAHTISVHAHPYRFSDAPTGNTKDDRNCVRAKIRHVSDGVKIVGIGRKRWCSSGKPSTCSSYIGCSFIPWTVTYRSDR